MLGKNRSGEKQVTDSVAEEARMIVSAAFLDSNVIKGLNDTVVYSFILTYRDGHCRILECRADDPLLQAVLPMATRL